MNPVWSKLTGTQVGKFILGLAGVTLKNSAASLQVKNNADTAFADVQAKDVIVSNNSTGFDVTFTASGSQGADYTLTLPVDDGSPAQVLATDGSGVLSWITIATSQAWTAETTNLVFGSTSPVTMFTLPANSIIDKVAVYIDTAFDGTPTMSVGVNGGSASKYVASGDVLMTTLGRYDVPNTEIPVGSTEALEITYAAGGASVGAARVVVTYAVPI